jgi:hypothetical protein
MFEVDQRAVARAEVVECELYAQVLQFAELGDGLPRILHRRFFRDLEHETTGVQTSLA